MGLGVLPHDTMKLTRHWKQVFDPDADFIFLKKMGEYSVGDTVPKDICSGHRAKVWWRGGFIGLKDWDYEKGKPTSGPKYTALGAGWYQLADGTRVRGKKELAKALGESES